MPIRTIRDVDNLTWKKMREISTRKKIRMGKLLEEMTSSYSEKEGKEWWEWLKNRKPSLTEKEADEMLEFAKKLRKEPGYRDFNF